MLKKPPSWGYIFILLFILIGRTNSNDLARGNENSPNQIKKAAVSQKNANTKRQGITSKQATIISKKVLCKQPGRYIGWPSITKSPGGELLVVFSGDREGHICPFGKTQLIRSRDNGQTWTEPVTINDTPFDDRDAGIFALRDGTLLASFFCIELDVQSPNIVKHYPLATRERWKPFVAKITDTDREKWLTPNRIENRSRGHWIMRSENNGQSWEEPVAVAASTPHGIAVNLRI